MKLEDGFIEGQSLLWLTEYYICNQREVSLSMYKAVWERLVAQLLALSKAVRVRTRLLFVGRASENAVSLQMRGFYKAKDTENGHICRSSHAVYKVTSAWGCLSTALLRGQWDTLASEITQENMRKMLMRNLCRIKENQETEMSGSTLSFSTTMLSFKWSY